MLDMSIICSSGDEVAEPATGITGKECVLSADAEETPLVRELILDIKDLSCCFSEDAVPEMRVI